MTQLPIILPEWPAPDNIIAFTTTRIGGVSKGEYQGLNLADHVGDNRVDVEDNRHQLLSICEGLDSIKWLQQVHSITAIEAEKDHTEPADASYTSQIGIGCAVMTADCLPLLVCHQDGREVAAIHAGWRGLLDGVIESTIHLMKSTPGELLVWLGPAISSQHYEVGPEIHKQFVLHNQQAASAFTPSEGRKNHFMANLYMLAKQRLEALGVNAVYGGDHCTYTDRNQFYSYRRDGKTGRIASLIYRKSRNVLNP